MKREERKIGYPSIDKFHLKNVNFMDRHPIIPPISVYSLFRLLARRYKEEYSIDCLGLRVTYKELQQDIQTMAKGLLSLKIKKNDIIVVLLPNTYHGVITFFAANCIGATVTFLNVYTEHKEIIHYLKLYKSPLFINYDFTKEQNKEILEDAFVKHIITVKEEDIEKRPFEKHIDFRKQQLLDFSELGFFENRRYNKNYFSANKNALILYTSGTTGFPKSVVLTNKNIVASAIYLKNTTHMPEVRGEKCLVCVPFTYPYGFVTSLVMTLLCGREAVVAPTLDKSNISYYIAKKPNIIFGSPALLELMKNNISEKQELSFLHTFISGGDFLNAQKEKEGKEFFKLHNSNAVIYNGSGNAESCGGSTSSVGSPIKMGTVGVLHKGTDGIIIDDNMKELPYGKEGQLCITGKHIFKEYYGDKERTKEATFIYKGRRYLKTGSVGILDADGYFTLTNRDTRFYIISSLNKIYCDYVQNIMSGIDVIDEVAVVKKVDNDMLYKGVAFVVPKQGIASDSITKQYIWDKCKRPIEVLGSGKTIQLKDYEIPAYIEFVDELPRTKANKIDYGRLEELAKIISCLDF